MNPRQPILLTPYRLPTDSALYLGDEEIAAFLNGWRALWHPAALAVAEGLPRIASPYDHEEPSAGLLIAIPDQPPLMLADDWQERARQAGAVVFTATMHWDETLANLRAALEPYAAHPALFHLSADQCAPFFGLGFGAAHLAALFEAMQQDNHLDSPEFVADVAAAVEAAAEGRPADEHLQSAAARMLAAREVAYPAVVHVLELYMPDDGGPWPATLDAGLPLNILACGQTLERIAHEQPQRMAQLRERCAGDLAEVVGGPFREREDLLLPLESQLANLRLGLRVTEELTGVEVRVFGRRRGGLHAQMPLLLQSSGIGRCLLTAFDESLIPSHSSTVVSWPSHDGKQVDAFTRTPLPADSPQTYFHVAHHLHQTVMQDQSATLALMHRDKAAPIWHSDWLALTRLAPVLGKWTTMSGYFGEVTAGDYTSAASPDDFSADFLSMRTTARQGEGEERIYPTPHPISEFAGLLRQRRQIDAALTFSAILHALRGTPPEGLTDLEDRFERGEVMDPGLAVQAAAEALAQRLVARGQPGGRGWLVLNPCSFIRRVVADLPDCPGPIPVQGHVKASQLDGTLGRAVVEVPALGFAWVQRPAGPAPVPPARIRTADERCIRNEYLEVEIDPATGCLKALRDVRTRAGRMGQQLVYNPGSTTRGTSSTFTAGTAMGEITTEGEIVGEDGQTVARFRQRFRVWVARPLLEIRIELEPLAPVEGYPWHSYLGCRFAWRDEGAPVLRGVGGMSSATSSTRPESPDFIEVRVGARNTVILPGGLPFHQRHGSRMLDTILITEGETARTFDLAVALDREQPMQTALGHASPAPVVACTQGPPHIGPTGWLFHLDAPNVLLSSLRPTDGDGVIATLLEISGHGGPAGLRCVRDPASARMLDLKGNELMDPVVEGDTALIDMGPNDLCRLRVEFT